MAIVGRGSKHGVDRRSAVRLELDLDANDSVQKLFSRRSGLFVVTRNKILRVRDPDQNDPTGQHDNAPWEQSIYLPRGSSDELVARTIIQSVQLAEIFFSPRSPKYTALMDVSWEMMNSLISLRFIKDRLEQQVSKICSAIEKDVERYTQGPHPKPLPIVDYFDIEFRSFVNETRRALTKISELFGILTSTTIKDGHFNKALEWARAYRGRGSLLALMLAGDQQWIKMWIDVRITIEHPKANAYVETSNFVLEPSRTVRLPTWRFGIPNTTWRDRKIFGRV